MASSSSSAPTARARARAAGAGGRWGSPERSMVWTEPKPSTTNKQRRKVAVVYYLCHRNGQLEHPHFMEMEAPLSSSDAGGGGGGLYLRDFTQRLNMLRGNGTANIYSWSSKRSYRNGVVWHDLTEDDLIHPAHANEYILKGSLLLLLPHHHRHHHQKETPTTTRRNWSSFDLGNYRAAEMSAATDAATQTHDPSQEHANPSTETELAIDEISPPPSSSSPDTLETLINNDVKVADQLSSWEREVGVIAAGRMRASSMLMQLISCGSITPRGRSDLSSHPRSTTNNEEKDSAVGSMVVDRDYFSGSLIESNKTTGDRANSSIGALKRSSSYNTDSWICRGAVKMELGANSNSKEMGGVRAKCIPRKPKSTAAAARRELANGNSISALVSGGAGAAEDGKLLKLAADVSLTNQQRQQQQQEVE